MGCGTRWPFSKSGLLYICYHIMYMILYIVLLLYICGFKVLIMASESWSYKCIFVAYKASPFHRIDSIWSSKEGFQHILILASSYHLHSSERACLEFIPAPPQTSTAPLQQRFRYFPLTSVICILLTISIMMTLLIILTKKAFDNVEIDKWKVKVV